MLFMIFITLSDAPGTSPRGAAGKDCRDSHREWSHRPTLVADGADVDGWGEFALLAALI